MKKSLLHIVGLAFLLLPGSCRHPEVEVVDFDTFHPTMVSSSDILVGGDLNPEIRFMETEDDPRTKVASIAAIDLVKELLGTIESNRLTHIAGTYQGHDIDGSPITLSGKVLLPAKGKIKNMLIVSHFTIGANYECPSESFPLEGILAGKGYAVVIADYIGFGVTKDRIHPYMHVESTARSVVDMALAVKPYLEHIGRAPESDEVILLGYSQGGSTTLGVMDMIQDECEALLPIKEVYAGGGPYDLAATFDISMLEDLTGIPCAIPMIVQGVNEGEHLGLDIADFFKPVLLEHYNEWINSKNYTVKQINLLMDADSVSDLMTDVGRDKKNPQTARLYKALMGNSVLNFSPRHPLHFFHSTQDSTVPFINGQKAEEYFKGTDITFDFGEYGVHSAGAVRFIFNTYKRL
ncbi:MAG: alpha/beta hydrolase [Bacteroidales bacterium]|nr:alpha/beta hydrolase [Bacteroidales bacterium]